jgi:hypothetical protein
MVEPCGLTTFAQDREAGQAASLPISELTITAASVGEVNGFTVNWHLEIGDVPSVHRPLDLLPIEIRTTRVRSHAVYDFVVIQDHDCWKTAFSVRAQLTSRLLDRIAQFDARRSFRLLGAAS